MSGTTNGSQSQETARPKRPYVVLEETQLLEVVLDLFKQADVGLSPEEWDKVKAAAAETTGTLYLEVMRVPSRNARHALTQAGGRYDAGVTPPLVAVSERMFRAKRINVTLEAKVSIA